ncbi:MAG: hypothetical protein ACI86H_001537 [bacterium]|jgi:hypothetical protein
MSLEKGTIELERRFRILFHIVLKLNSDDLIQELKKFSHNGLEIKKLIQYEDTVIELLEKENRFILPDDTTEIKNMRKKLFRDYNAWTPSSKNQQEP